MRSALDKIATVVSGFLGGYWLAVLIGVTSTSQTALEFSILWLLILTVLRNI